jgi:ABC-type uncharacterized transport system fused permease/ATPase subunit
MARVRSRCQRFPRGCFVHARVRVIRVTARHWHASRSVVCRVYSRVLALYWQKQMILEMEEVYFKGKTLYAANKMVPSLDNMDQRIADDSRNASQGVMQFLFGTPLIQGVVLVRAS